MNKIDHCIFSSTKKSLKNSGLNRESNTDLCDASAVLYQLRYQANWEKVVISVDCKPVVLEIDDDNTGTFPLFEMQIGMKSI